ncbi:Transporter, ABC superfamily (Breast cancer resistance protein) [Handroanthus impetiginosus]|uniref:Transporter, ABC superfamily (Breast cancer resistance protein) n=1 Tax=Handroanthus impetiginosus TaxID=429701 RepID=A0A2G9HLF3_9LAMI|nr:Transporter, ABC superfamily (Breast cancer resistance protein) [Handroanthus impetiginosus]
MKMLAAITLIFLLGASSVSHAATEDDAGNTGGSGYSGDAGDAPVNSVAMQLLSQELFKGFSNFSAYFGPEIAKHLGYCISNVDAEWNAAFNFSKNTQFLSECLKSNKDAVQRLCTAAEVKFYGASLMQGAETGPAKSSNYLKPNKNCNLSSWPEGCEPGWACSVGADTKVELKNDKEIPPRELDCRPCCEGFFCPHGLTCMIPCPLGSYCPLAKLNKTTGVCDPYRYQLPPGQPNHTCGGADVWSDFLSGNELFCSAGFYCPSTVQKIPCSKGHFCRAGSTAQTSCYQLATCEPQTANQNITAYGLIFFGGITLVLLIIYNCSGQVLSTREKKQAKSREAAARSARETVQARERWKSAKDVARKGASELQSQLSRTFSRKKSVMHEAPKTSGQPKPGSDAALPPMPSGSSNSKDKKKKQTNLTKMMRDIEENPDSEEGFNLEIGDKNLKKNAAKAKQLHTRSQIFKYAYGQIEKEKALQEQNKNLTFSGVISIASDLEITSRPPIEVFFQDLTLTLRGKNKHLLRCVTGKLVPGHVSAVMGPSGAGKTTFLSALMGKATGCTITGRILINGKEEPMQSYKKIIGYVPQDDIVHGNLTVEENLWFSARCRLPADLDKPEKVLVVERVIESLGLQAVRDSLVGTVEKRGISGGQRKRVNVGLEMVMEPSLLILDEPTSGLDSSSSLLLLRALRREALEGVNICMVVHQPSYTLFKMFDDLILLAKGGLTVYHGPVKKVEEYFAGLGIHVPERVNPPDYFIDILEGIIKPSSSSAVKFKELPLRWMLHNGYPVPPDMLDSAEMPSSSTGDSTHGASSANNAESDQSFAGELWQDVKFTVGQKKDHIRHNFNKSMDLSNRKTPSVSQQYKYFVGRLGKQRLREARIQAVDYLILLLAGICLGTLAKVSDETFGSTGYLYTVIAVSLLCKISALRSFSLDKLHYWRESASGMSSLAYFLAKDTIDHFNTIVKPAVYLSMFYFFNNPRSTIFDNYLVLLCHVYCVTGIAYVLAIYFEPGPAQLWSVLLPVVLTLIANQEGDSIITQLGDFCYTKWALEAFLLANAKRYSGVWLIQRCGALRQRGYDLKHYYPCLAFLLCTGIFSRAIAFFCLVTFQKK